MKLSNQQVEALVNQAMRKNKEKRDSEVTVKPVQKEEADRIATESLELINKLHPTIRSAIREDASFDFTKRSFTKIVIDSLEETTQPTTPQLDRAKLRDDLWVASIDATDLNALKEQFKEIL